MPIWAGIGPEMRPGLTTSSVSEVRFAMEGERVPMRPGESERPVPSVRAETLRVESEGSKEQEMPVNFVQGSDEGEKSQVEKKVEPETSRRRFRISKRACISNELREFEGWR